MISTDIRQNAVVKYNVSYYPHRTGEPEQDEQLLINRNDSINFGDICDEPNNIPVVTSIHPLILFGNIHFSIIVDRSFKIQIEHNACDGFRHIIVAKEEVEG